MKEVTSIWDNVNPKICIIGPEAACGKIFKEWKNAKSCAKKKSEGLHHFMNNSLKDWINCLILLTANVGFLSVQSNHVLCCGYKAHVVCNCSRDEKIPLMELQFMLSQRSKLGERYYADSICRYT